MKELPEKVKKDIENWRVRIQAMCLNLQPDYVAYEIIVKENDQA